MIRYFFLFTIVPILAACAPSSQSIETAIARTQSALSPTPSPTDIPFSSLNLEDKIIIAGDMPPGFFASQIGYTPGGFTKRAPITDYYISQIISHNNAMGGIVDVLIYEDINKVTIAYQSILDAMIMTNSEDAGVGEKSISSNDSGPVVTDLAFIRCHAAVHIQFIGSSNKSFVIAYGQRLDKRLQPIVCRL